VDETKTAAVIQFGKIVRIVKEPGLHFKLPFIQGVRYLSDRVLIYDIQSKLIVTSDEKGLYVNNYAFWKIEDPKVFIQSMRTVDSAQARIDDVVFSNLRDTLAEHTLNEIVSKKRIEYLKQVTEASQENIKGFGVNLVDVRVKRADLPPENETAVYNRMKSKWEAEAELSRAQGDQEARKIRSAADRDVNIILADAKKQAEQLKGEGDAKALEIYANAYNQNQEFYQFWRSLESYKKSFEAGSTIVLSTDSDYLQFLESKKLIK
jgi:membrane protease subunit HflC